MKRAIVSLGNSTGNYMIALQRLSASLQGKWDGGFFAFTSEEQVGAPPHRDNPYAFKIYAIDAVRRKGYDQILWVDASVYAIRPVQPVFDLIDRDGYVMQEAGWLVGQWCNDKALMYFNVTRGEAMKMPMYGNAGLLGLDFRKEISVAFFSRWKSAMLNGIFRGSWSDHRHDMSCGSIIANQLGMKYQAGDQLLQYASPEAPVLNQSIVFKAQGL